MRPRSTYIALLVLLSVAGICFGQVVEVDENRTLEIDFTREALSKAGSLPFFGQRFCYKTKGDKEMGSRAGKGIDLFLASRPSIAEGGTAILLELSVKIVEDGDDRSEFLCRRDLLIRPPLGKREIIKSVDSRSSWPTGLRFRAHGELRTWWKQDDWLEGYKRDPGTYWTRLEFRTDGTGRLDTEDAGFSGVAALSMVVSRIKGISAPAENYRYKMLPCDRRVQWIRYDLQGNPYSEQHDFCPG